MPTCLFPPANVPVSASYSRIDLPTKGGVEVGILGDQKIKTPGNAMNCPENLYFFFFTHPSPGGSGGGDTISKVR